MYEKKQQHNFGKFKKTEANLGLHCRASVRENAELIRIPAIHVVWRLVNVRRATLDAQRRMIKFELVVHGFEKTERWPSDSIERRNGPA